MAYVIFALVPILLWKFFKEKKWYFICVYAFFGIVSGIRGINVGDDTVSYHFLYSKYNELSLFNVFERFPGKPEPGTWTIMQLTSLICDDAQMYIFISSFLTYVFLGIFIYKNVDKRYGWMATFLVVAVDFFFFQLSVMRQSLATAIICNSYQHAIKSKYIKVVCISILAAMFHYVVLVALPVLLLICYLSRKEIRQRELIKIIGIMCFAAVLIAYIGYFIMTHPSLIPGAFQTYLLVTSQYNATVDGGLYRIVQIFIFAIMSLFCTLFVNEEFERKRIVAIDILLIEGIMCVLAGIYVAGFFHRIVGIFFIYSSLLIPCFLKSIKSKEMRCFIEFCVIVGGILHVIFNVQMNLQGAVPYTMFFE